MPPPARSSLAEPLPHRFARWVWELIEYGSRHGQGWTRAALLIAIAATGWVDYVTGTRVSFTPLYSILVMLSAVWLGWRVAVGASFLCLVVRVIGDLAAGGYDIALSKVAWNRFSEIIEYLLLVALLQSLISLQRELEQRVRQRTQALQQSLLAREELQAQLFDASRRERNSLGQHLAATALAAKMLGNRLATEQHPAATDASRLVRLLQDGIAQTRQIARGLLLAQVEPQELLSELEELASRITRENGVACQLTTEAKPRIPDVSHASHLFYIAQEAVRNAIRHAHPTRIDVALRETDEGLLLTVMDDGDGPHALASGQGLGLRVMAHRAELMGARFTFGAAPGRGSRVQCLLPPLPPPSP